MSDGSAEALLGINRKAELPEDVSEFTLSKANVELLELEAVRLNVGCDSEDGAQGIAGDDPPGDATEPWRVFSIGSEGSGLDGESREAREDLGSDDMIGAGTIY